MLNREFAVALLLVGFFGCKSMCQDDHWSSFEIDNQIDDFCEQTDHLVIRTIHWKSANLEEFEISNVLSLADKNGWTPVDTQFVSSQKSKMWERDGDFYLPLCVNGEIGDCAVRSTYLHFTFLRTITQDFQVIRCQTDKKLTYPGSTDFTNENGFILVGADHSELSVHQLWTL